MPFLRVGFFSKVRNSINAGDTNAAKGAITQKMGGFIVRPPQTPPMEGLRNLNPCSLNFLPRLKTSTPSFGAITQNVGGWRILGLSDAPKEGAVVRKLCKKPNEFGFKYRNFSFGGVEGGRIMNPPIFSVIASPSEGFGEAEKTVPSQLLSDHFFRRNNAGYRRGENSKYTLLVLFTLFIFLFSSCGRKNRAGFGGQANVTFHAYHHSLQIDSFTVYLKFNTLDAPSDNEYDTQQASVKVNGQGQALISGLKKGDYYVFSKGWDSTIQKEVKGGMPYSVNSETNLSADIAVTED